MRGASIRLFPARAERVRQGVRRTEWLAWLCLATVFCLFSVGSAQIAAAAPLGATAAEVTGQVTVTLPGGAPKPLNVGDRLEPSHVLETGVAAHAVLDLDDGSRVEVFEATRIEINELLPEEESKFSMSLFFGRISAKLKKLRGDDVVITPTMVAGVRGTAFSANVADDGASVVSVEEGTVSVATDRDGTITNQVAVGPGNEVMADQAGVTLKPRPITLASFDDFKVFRQQRLEAMQADLPQIISRLETGIDTRLASLDRLKAMPMDRAEILKDLDEKAKELGPEDAGQLAKLAIRAHLEAGNVLKMVRDFRRQRMRLKNTFVQSQRLKSLLPNFSEKLGPEYATVDDGLKRILARQEEVEQKEQSMAMQFNQSIAPIQPLLDKFKAPEAEGSEPSAAKPIMEMFQKKLKNQ